MTSRASGDLVYWNAHTGFGEIDLDDGRGRIGIYRVDRRWCTDAGEPTVLLLPGPWCQMARMETGFATRIMRLSTSVAIAASPRWAGKMRACSFGPMIAL